MAEKLYKVNEAIELGYQAPNKESGLVSPNAPVAEIYLPNKQKDSTFPDVELIEVGSSGTYRGSFTPDQQGEWQVVMHKANGDGQVARSFSVGGYNVDSVGQNTDNIKSTVDGMDTQLDTMDTQLDTIENKIDAIDTPPMAF